MANDRARDVAAALERAALSIEQDVERLRKLAADIRATPIEELRDGYLGHNVADAVFSVTNNSGHVSALRHAVTTAFEISAGK